MYLNNAVIENPFTYYDGEHYVDGYSVLVAYAVDSVIRNCGMDGEIYTASPSEAEYLLEKASPSDADALSGPGVKHADELERGPELTGETETAEITQPEEDLVISSTEAGGGPGMTEGGGDTSSAQPEKETETEPSIGPSGETGESSETEESSETGDRRKQ